MSPLPFRGFSGSSVSAAAWRSYTRLPPRTGAFEQAALLVRLVELPSGVLADRPTLPHTVRSRTIETPEMRMAPVLRIRPPVNCMGPPLAGCDDPCKAIELALVQ